MKREEKNERDKIFNADALANDGIHTRALLLVFLIWTVEREHHKHFQDSGIRNTFHSKFIINASFFFSLIFLVCLVVGMGNSMVPYSKSAIPCLNAILSLQYLSILK